ncbi:MAG: Hsp20/alpha crystallin family protein [Verrucomicrobia bacterium]|nr:Hsp20/alpha crystallin family protein [Verrucomicrobiota bacterium]MCH8513943.1 Hsp20/alpha crystallin family protein [Kiritimatiellia bacterium]
MTATKEMVKNEKNEVREPAREGEVREARPARELRLEPAADVFRDDQGVRVLVDLPGVSEDALDVQLHDGVLNIEGRAPRGDDITRVYNRSFRVDSRIDTQAIDATMRLGVLTLTLPFRAEAQPRRITVKANAG